MMRTRRTFIKEIGAGTTGVTLFPFFLKASGKKDIEALSNQKYDLLIYGATPAGVACAVRAAREGLKVMLVSYFPHIGGLLTNGIGVWDTLYEGSRSPVYDELRQSVFEYYKNKYGEQSVQYKDALPGETGHSNGTFEPKVIESLIDDLIRKEENIHLLTELYPVNAIVAEGLIRSIEFSHAGKDIKVTLEATFYADCSYEGDLLPLLKLPYRLGREPRSEYNEPHAGKIFMRNLNELEFDKELDLRQFGWNQAIIYPESTGEGDKNIQAFNLRTILTSDPENRIEITKPDDYDPDMVRELEFSSGIHLPNNKICWNRPQLLGIHQKYIEGDWTARKEVIRAHRKAVLNLLYFLQNDNSVDPELQNHWKKFGLPKDEFTDNGHLPYEIYVREGRRLVGEYVITQYDLMPDLGQKRVPVKYDSIGITEWYMDTHACTKERTRDSLYEGAMMLYYDSYPGQVPFRSLYNKKIKNFVVPVCLSGTHVAWGAIRLEATWMNIAESAALAVKMAVHEKKWIDGIDIDKLQIELAEKRIMTGFFNHFDIRSNSPLVPAVQYFSAKGFFNSYDFSPEDPIDEHTAISWIENYHSIISKKHHLIKVVPELQASSSPVSAKDFNNIMKKKGIDTHIEESSGKLSQGQAILFLYGLVKSFKKQGNK